MMSISTERLMAVFKPLQFRTSKLSTSQIVHFLVFILPPLLIAILLNVPKFLEIEFVINETNSGSFVDLNEGSEGVKE